TNGVVPLTVTFTNTSSGTITNDFWSFGDNATTSTLSTNVPHTYPTAGVYSVTLIASGPLGVRTNMKSSLIVAVNPPNTDVRPDRCQPCEFNLRNRGNGLNIAAHLRRDQHRRNNRNKRTRGGNWRAVLDCVRRQFHGRERRINERGGAVRASSVGRIHQLSPLH